MTKEEITKGLNCCSEFLCGECPYKIYHSHDYPIKCIHRLMVDLNEIYGNATTIATKDDIAKMFDEIEDCVLGVFEPSFQEIRDKYTR